MDNDSDSDLKKQKPGEIIDEITQDLGQLHGELTEGAELTGYALQCYRSMRKRWEDIESSPEHPDKETFLETSVASLEVNRNAIRGIRIQASETLRKVPFVARHAHSFFAGTASTESMLSLRNFEFVPPTPPLKVFSENGETYADRFARFDTALGKTYRAISEILYGTRSDPERAALYLIRHAFDHFFNKLAPDDKVIPSQFFRTKEGNKPDQIHRKEKRYSGQSLLPSREEL